MSECAYPSHEFDYNELLLRAARNGDAEIVKTLLYQKADGALQLDLNCKGQSKINFGWSPLHLASYFGHTNVVELLLSAGANVNAVNTQGDTPLHKAAFTGREKLVMLLLKNDADITIINGDGRTPKNMCENETLKQVLEGAELADTRRREQALLTSVKDGDLELLTTMLKDKRLSNINCTDDQGNTCLHCAAYLDYREMAVLLLQNGIHPSIKNNTGQTALDLATTPQMKQILDVRPLRSIQKVVSRFEGPLLKKVRLLGWRIYWVVLERGVMAYFKTLADASLSARRKDCRYLCDAQIVSSSSMFVVNFSDGSSHKLSIPPNTSSSIGQQKWLDALRSHIQFCSEYLKHPVSIEDSDDEEKMVKPLGSMKDALQTSSAHQQVLTNQVESLQNQLNMISSTDINSSTVHVLTFLQQAGQLCENSRNMLSSLSHCLILFEQQEEVRELKLKQEKERCRVLEEALMVLAREHHQSEEALRVLAKGHSHSTHRTSSDEEFYDAFENDSIGDV